MYSPDHNASPVNPLPPIILALAGAITLIEVAFQLGSRGYIGGPQSIAWRQEAAVNFGFFDPVFEHLVTTGDFQPEFLMRFFTYPFIHASLMHAVMGVVLLLALGNFVARILPTISVIILVLLASFFGAVAYGLANDTRLILIGIYPVVYGLIGTYTWILWVTARAKGENPIAAFRMIGLLAGLQLVFFLMSGQGSDLPSDGAGFVTGFIFAPVLVKGGIINLRNRLRG